MGYFLLVNTAEKSTHVESVSDEEGGHEVTQIPSYKKYPELQDPQTLFVESQVSQLVKHGFIRQ